MSRKFSHLIKSPLFYLFILFLLTRLTFLTLLPIYADEANYLDWGWRSFHAKNLLFYSLYDSKQPLLIWAFGLAEMVIPDPLLAGRLVTVMTGLICLVGIFQLSTLLFDRKTGLIASVLYTLIPLFAFFDRQILMETSVAAVGIWSFYFLTKLITHHQIKYALLLGLTLGIGFFIKSNVALFLLPLTVIVVIIMIRQPQRAISLVNLLIFSAIAFCVSCAPLLLQSQFWSTLHTNSRYSLGLGELIKFPLSLWIKNITGVINIALVFLTPLIFSASVVSLYKLPKKYYYFLIWIGIPLVVVILTTRGLIIRYPAPFLVPLVILSARFLSKNKYLLISSLIPAIFLTTLLIFSPPQYFLTTSKFSRYSFVSDYVTGNTTGYLVNSIRDALKPLSTTKPTIITFALNSGNFEAALIDYYHKHPTIITSYFDSRLFPPGYADQYDCFQSPYPFYFVARQEQLWGLDRFLVKHSVVKAPYSQDFATIYTLKTGCPIEKTFPLNLVK